MPNYLVRWTERHEEYIEASDEQMARLNADIQADSRTFQEFYDLEVVETRPTGPEDGLRRPAPNE